MATRAGVCTWTGRRTAKVVWSGLANGDVGDDQDFSRFTTVTFQALGTFGVGGSVSIEGSNDGGTTRAVVNDSRGEGNALTFTGADVRKANERPLTLRPNVTAGDGTTALTIIAIASADV